MKTMAVAIPADRVCGIHDHAAFLNEELEKHWQLVEIPMPQSQTAKAWKKTAKEAGQADIVLVHYEYGLFQSVKPYRNHYADFFKSLKLPAVVILHDLLPKLSVRWSSQKVYRLRDGLKDLAYLPFFSTWTSRLYRLADHFIIHAPQLLAHVKEYGILEKVSFMQHPIPAPIRQWSVGQTKKNTFITPGFVKEHKGYLFFLQVLASHPEWTWSIAGGPQNETDQRFINNLQLQIQEAGLIDQVTISGYQSREKLERMMSESELAIFPYQQVINSGAVAWAIGMGMPVMSTDLDTFKSLVSEDAGLALLPLSGFDQWPFMLERLLQDTTHQQQLADLNKIFTRLNSYKKMALQISEIAKTVLYNPT